MPRSLFPSSIPLLAFRAGRLAQLNRSYKGFRVFMPVHPRGSLFLRLMKPQPQWVLTCGCCQKSFAHSEIPAARNLLEYFYPPKPVMPGPGQPLRCPYCQKVSHYFQSDLRYQRGVE